MRVSLPVAALLIVISVIAATWPFAFELSKGVSDLGDPMLNSWALAWVAHTLPRAPATVFDASIFFPETTTLAYSEPLLVPALLVAPVIWLGGDPILAHNVLVLLGYAGSGVAMFVLVRSLTGQDGAALVSGVMFAVFPYRTESFAKVQMEMTMWWPIALWCVHRAAAEPARRRWGFLLGLSLALQAYSGVYVVAYGLVTAGVVSLATWLTAPSPRRARLLATFATAGLVAIVLTLPLALAFQRASARVGERTLEAAQIYSAEWRDYLRPHPEQQWWGRPASPGPAERRLFPGYVAPALAIAGTVAGGPMAAAYEVAAILNVYLSRGANTAPFRWLFTHVAPMRAFRVPARFGMLLGLVLSVLSGYGVARLTRGRSRAIATLVVAACVIGSVVEGRIRPPELSSPGERAPSVYDWLARQDRGAVCEFPVRDLRGRVGPQDSTYMYYSARHWQPLVNGYSGFTPPSYDALVDGLRGFPNAAAVAALQAHHVRYLLVHERYYVTGDFASDVATLQTHPDLLWVGAFSWADRTRTAVFFVSRK